MSVRIFQFRRQVAAKGKQPKGHNGDAMPADSPEWDEYSHYECGESIKGRRGRLKGGKRLSTFGYRR